MRSIVQCAFASTLSAGFVGPGDNHCHDPGEHLGENAREDRDDRYWLVRNSAPVHQAWKNVGVTT